MGGGLPSENGPRVLERPGGSSSHQSSGDQSNLPCSLSLAASPRRQTSPHSVRQRHGRGVHKPPGRYSQQAGNVRSGKDTVLGRASRSGDLRRSHSRGGELGSRLQSPGSSVRRMVPSSHSLQSDMPALGHPGCRSHRISDEQQSSSLCSQVQGSSSRRLRRPGNSVVPVPTTLPVSSPCPNPKGGQKGKVRGHPSHSGGSRLAKTSLVCGVGEHARGRPLEASRPSRSSLTRPPLPPEFSVSEFNGMAVEAAILSESGFSSRVIQTMIRARKPASSHIYHRYWKAFFRWCNDNDVFPLSFSIPSICGFLQSGLDAGLSLSTLKGQVSALAILFQKDQASLPQVKTFLQGVAHVAPPHHSPIDPWDLNLVLGALQKAPFEPIQDIPLSLLSWKVAFLIAITSIRRVSELAALSCRSPYLILHQDKVVLRPVPSFLPKVVSPFHINEDIVLPSFCPAPAHPLEKSLHKLDVVRALRVYLARTASFRQSDSLLVISEGRRKGLPASKSTIARWIRSTILEAYQL
ncbi:uncharacterized protein [Dendrobates tinctorius]|uniref:uncharacterized protein n=1 Tax=Dendrobates tinctorius TaxID=92724 RepID=UPI003CCA00AE